MSEERPSCYCILNGIDDEIKLILINTNLHDIVLLVILFSNLYYVRTGLLFLDY